MNMQFKPGSDMRVTHLFKGAPTRGRYLGIILQQQDAGAARVASVIEHDDAHGVGGSLHAHPCHGMTLEELQCHALDSDAYAVVLREGDAYHVASDTLKRRRQTALRLSE
jgi:hypothetical protein